MATLISKMDGSPGVTLINVADLNFNGQHEDDEEDIEEENMRKKMLKAQLEHAFDDCWNESEHEDSGNSSSSDEEARRPQQEMLFRKLSSISERSPNKTEGGDNSAALGRYVFSPPRSAPYKFLQTNGGSIPPMDGRGDESPQPQQLSNNKVISDANGQFKPIFSTNSLSEKSQASVVENGDNFTAINGHAVENQPYQPIFGNNLAVENGEEFQYNTHSEQSHESIDETAEAYRQAEYNTVEQLRVLYEVRMREIKKLQADKVRAANHQQEMLRRLALVEAEKQRAVLSRTEASKLLVACKEEIGKLQKEVETQNQTITSLEKDKAKSDETAEMQTIHIQELEQRIELMERFDSNKTAAKHTEAVIKELKARQQQETKLMQKEVDSLSKKLSKKEEECRELERRVGEQQRAQEQLLVDKADTVNQLARRLEESQTQCSQLMTANTTVENARLQNQLGEALREKEQLSQTVANLQASIAETGNSDVWPLERPEGMPAIQSLEVMCGKDHMDVHLSFTQPFEGIVSSKGQYGDPRCVYVPPSTGKTFFSFRIAYARCGTKPDLHGQFYENTVVVQYDKDLLEVWDEAKRLRCEWYNDYEKTASKPPMVIADLDVIQLDFRGDNVDCWMEIQHGKGPWAPPVSGIVPLGSTLTLVVAINDYRGEFDMRVKSCAASDGGGHIIQLSDEHGCVLRPKMISRFLKARIADERASVITYAFFHAFKFPDALSVHIKCKVEICRHGCLDHCQVGDESYGESVPQETYRPLERRDPVQQKPTPPEKPEVPQDSFGDLIYDDISNIEDELINRPKPPMNQNHPEAQHQTSGKNPAPIREIVDDIPRPFHEPQIRPAGGQERFPHGPRNLDSDSEPVLGTLTVSQRRRRSVVVSDRKVRSADVGVSGLYEVISEADLAFTPDSKAEAVTVFQGRIREEVVYGICLPVPGFSVLFLLVALSSVVSALVAGSLLYRYRVQRETQLRLLRARARPAPPPQTSADRTG